MPIEIAPNRIDLASLDGGFMPDTPESAVPLNGSPDALNLLLEKSSRQPETRKGFTRLVREASLTGYYVKHVFYYETIDAGTRKRYLIAIMSNGGASANNVQLWRYDLVNSTFSRIDTAGRTWNNSKAPHWSVVVGGIYYGGVRGDAIYSWHPTDGWDADPTALNSPKTWIDAINDGVNTATQLGRDYAYRKKQKVEFNPGGGVETFSTLRDIRYDKWESGTEYKKGDLVSRKAVWASSSSYWKSFEALRDHTSATNNAPGTSSASGSYWKKVRLPNIFDDDNEIQGAWTPSGNGVKSSVGVFYGDRMMVRRDNENDRSKVQYSAPLALEKNVDLPDVLWDPTDWAAVDTINGEGGGWFPVSPGRGDAIRDMADFGNYLIVSKRWSSHVLTGRSEQTWTLRKLGDLGAIANQTITELEGLAYGLSHTGELWVSDGTSQRAVPGAEKAREFIKERIDRLLQAGDSDDEHWMPSIESYDGKVWIALPDQESAGTPDDIVMVYDPTTESWWKLDLPVLSFTKGAKNRAMRLYFSAPLRGGGAVPALFEYGDDPGNLVFTDEDPNALSAGTTTDAIPWRWKTAWMQWGITQQDRRIRRTWALVKTAVSVTVDGYRNFLSSSAFNVTRSADTGNTSFIEGKRMADAHAVALKVSGTAATGGPSVIGFGVDTQPRRTRFHRN
jgi:hypothetical protein